MNRKSQNVWESLCASPNQQTSAKIAETSSTSKTYVSRLLREWAADGFAVSHKSKNTNAELPTIGPPDRVLYSPMKNPPETAPKVRHAHSGGGVINVESDMDSHEFTTIRQRLGLSTESLGRALGWTGSRSTANRNVRRFENGDKPISQALADKLRDLK